MSSKAGLDRAAVVHAAASLADTRGFEEVTLAQLAKQLGIRTPSLYNHIAGLDGLRRELALLGTRELTLRMGKAVMGKTRDEAIMALALAYRAFVKEHPGLYAATIRSSAFTPDSELQAAQQESVEVVLRVLAAYGLHDALAIHLVRGLRSVVHGFVSLESAGGFGIPLEIDESFRILIRSYIHGLDHNGA